MSEIDEVAQAIQDAHPELWPLSKTQARALAEREAGDQGNHVVSLLADALENRE